MLTVFGRTLNEIADLIDQHERSKAMPYDTHQNVATFSAEAFTEAMNLMDMIKEGHRVEAIQRRLFEVMRLTAESAGQVTMEVQHDGKTGMPDMVQPVAEWNRKFVTDDPILNGLQYDTVLGWLAKNAPSYLAGLLDPIEDTKRDGFWLTHRCHEHGREVIKVRSPEIMPNDLPMVNAYPVEWIEQRFREKGVI